MRRKSTGVSLYLPMVFFWFEIGNKINVRVIPSMVASTLMALILMEYLPFFFPVYADAVQSRKNTLG